MARPRPRTRTPRRATAATPVAFVRALLLAFEKYGESPAEVLRQSQIAPELLDDPAGKITSRKMPWGSLGMLCRASLPSPDLGVALRRWFRHHRLLTGDIELRLEVAGGRATVSIVEHRDLGAKREFCLVSYLRYVHGYVCWVIDSFVSLLEIGFPFPRPPHGSVYPLLFPGPVSFGAERAHFSFDARYLALAQRRDDAALRAMLKRALPLTVLQYRRDRLLVARVRRLLGERPSERHDPDVVARQLHLSTRSLHRHLREEGASLQALKDEVRRDRAVELLARTSRPVKEIAGAVGFADEKSFSRAFKEWTGRSPREYRRSAAPA